ncbi:50S ribosomal protein L10 [Alicyclobacillus sp. ALC3]|uniref:50S ribosomal protein L10 n=1 Tax=Alicyclobacillus sp. ALC3 TaxID=2796143 RepID=UPI0023796768|nr:50S ribosomal protein L10 [Alicyclobacillus sp. ALC3]WDL98951.1 50S ribosomal protein L10 [Alicyclobacillus sp. ALC3]
MGVREEKVKAVEQITDRLNRSKGTVVTDYRGLSVAELTELRRQLRDAGVEYQVLKNTLSRRAADAANVPGLQEFLAGPSAIAFSYDDPVIPAKILNDFAKKHKALELKGGLVEGRVVGQAQVAELATLPNREGLLSMLLSVLQAPMRNFAYAVSQVAEQRGGEAEEA